MTSARAISICIPSASNCMPSATPGVSPGGSTGSPGPGFASMSPQDRRRAPRPSLCSSAGLPLFSRSVSRSSWRLRLMERAIRQVPRCCSATVGSRNGDAQPHRQYACHHADSVIALLGLLLAGPASGGGICSKSIRSSNPWCWSSLSTMWIIEPEDLPCRGPGLLSTSPQLSSSSPLPWRSTKHTEACCTSGRTFCTRSIPPHRHRACHQDREGVSGAPCPVAELGPATGRSAKNNWKSLSRPFWRRLSRISRPEPPELGAERGPGFGSTSPHCSRDTRGG